MVCNQNSFISKTKLLICFPIDRYWFQIVSWLFWKWNPSSFKHERRQIRRKRISKKIVSVPKVHLRYQKQSSFQIYCWIKNLIFWWNWRWIWMCKFKFFWNTTWFCWGFQIDWRNARFWNGLCQFIRLKFRFFLNFENSKSFFSQKLELEARQQNCWDQEYWTPKPQNLSLQIKP